MKNPILLKAVSIVAFVISAIFTILLMTSNTVGILAFVLTSGMAIILELCKVGFFYESIVNLKLPVFIRTSLGTISVLLVAASIFASGAFVQNQANMTKNKQLRDSVQFKQMEDGKALQKDLYEVKKKEIEDLKALQEQQKEAGANIINSMPKNYIDRKNAQRAQTQSQVAETQKLIDKKSGELSALGEALQSPINLSNVNISATNGYSAMFNTITDLINSTEDYKNRPIKTETLEMWFYIALGVIFEIVAVLTAYLGQLKSGTKMVSVKTEVLPEMGSDLTGMTIRPQVIDAIRKEYGDYRDDRDNRGPQSEIRGKRQIGFQAPERASECEERKDKSAEGAKPCVTQRGQDIDNKILGKYLDYIYANVKEDNSIPGYQVTANDLSKLHPELKLSCDYVRKLKNHCEQLKILKSDSERRATYIIRPRDEVKLCG